MKNNYINKDDIKIVLQMLVPTTITQILIESLSEGMFTVNLLNIFNEQVEMFFIFSIYVYFKNIYDKKKQKLVRKNI